MSETEPLYKITELPASAFPDIIGVVSFVVIDVVVSDIGASGTRVSTESVRVLLLSDPSVFVFPEESENFDEATLMTPSVVLSDVGVNVAV